MRGCVGGESAYTAPKSFIREEFMVKAKNRSKNKKAERNRRVAEKKFEHNWRKTKRKK